MDFHFFPLSTDVGKEIEKATSELLTSEDWSLNLNITDMVNQTDNGPDDAMWAIRKRLTNRNQRVVQLALTVLETCVKNSGLRFHEKIATQEFMDTFTTVASEKSVCGERARAMLTEWVDAFKSSPGEFGPVYDAYDNLQKQGYVFPSVDFTKSAPINLPIEIPQDSPLLRHASQKVKMEPGAKEIEKLQGDLKVVEENIVILNGMIDELGPNDTPGPLLQDVFIATRAMHGRVIGLIDRLEYMTLMERLLETNDKLVEVLERYEQVFTRRVPDRYQTLDDDSPLLELDDITINSTYGHGHNGFNLVSEPPNVARNLLPPAHTLPVNLTFSSRNESGVSSE
eukprot:Ihof_evm19s5 gene=Ihof_evmTU19s5